MLNKTINYQLQQSNIFVQSSLIMGFLLTMLTFNLFFCQAESAAAAVDSINFSNDYTGQRLVPIYKVERKDNKIALTIDGAWGSKHTEQLLELFKQQDIKVSFFFAGIWLEKNPVLLDKILKAGHAVYNHSYTHPHLNSLTAVEIKSELKKTEQILAEHVMREEKTMLFRPPYGEYNNLVIRIARQLGYQVVQWSLDSHDWMDPGPEYIIERVKNNITAGDIILFHNNAANVVEILNKLIPILKEKYQFVKIDQLIYKNNYRISSVTGLQYQLKEAKDLAN
ncbi:polysaccharide deacetylase family protein [Halanaerobium salsuginis]|jgi:peptidoglycan/xylan/chitin deacetylase (PgdA/CDA1 family)|uniref:Peptidoglycan/xylan/chitin deacetylase, PgdA/CDA1 family n=1 Tax=Halanaerobium salsuginis TaxID=29563 RepID=A0A1I4FAT6_9FIRM|nr:polysaccharide deacetylase family protein [Halanaerobium salsuginis]SFL13977.1 Peptidoglycan/xylan/chitin deacetylase, PgdA/CDA1 family [Halanaerobium salsuginis]